jgi:hypothetical protein
MTLNSNQFAEHQQQLPLDWEGLERANRSDAVRGHTVRTLTAESDPDDNPSRKTYLTNFNHPGMVHKTLENSKMPTNLISRLSGPIEVHGSNNEEKAGFYNTKTNDLYMAGLDEPEGTKVLRFGLPHELGHRLDYTHNRAKMGTEFTGTKTGWLKLVADPRSEGFADGFADFHLGVPDPNHKEAYGKLSTISTPWHNLRIDDYRDHELDWDEGDQLIYHATRAHAAATGGRIPVDRPLPHDDYHDNRLGAGEHLHKLFSLSPHVEPALEHLGILDVAKAHISRWKENQPKVTQLSFEGDNDVTSMYTPVTHMSSQFY